MDDFEAYKDILLKNEHNERVLFQVYLLKKAITFLEEMQKKREDSQRYYGVGSDFYPVILKSLTFDVMNTLDIRNYKASETFDISCPPVMENGKYHVKKDVFATKKLVEALIEVLMGTIRE